jgi:hypothetical protein
MAPRQNIERLFSQLELEMTKSVSGRYFIVRSKVEEIFTRSEIDLAVRELDCEAHERPGLVKKILEQGRIVFAILIRMKEPGYIVRFCKRDCLDSKLPLVENQAQAILPERGRSFALEYQWQFIPYFFKQDMCDNHYEIDAVEMIFPFISEDPISEGGFGQVSRVEIPGSSQALFPNKVCMAYYR